MQAIGFPEPFASAARIASRCRWEDAARFMAFRPEADRRQPRTGKRGANEEPGTPKASTLANNASKFYKPFLKADESDPELSQKC